MTWDARQLLILIPAAGGASRMGGSDKCLEDVSGEPALRRAARLAAATGAQVVVTLPAGGPFRAGRLAALDGLALRPLTVADSGEGMAASLRAGACAAAGLRAMMVLMPDMPGIGAADLATVIGRFALDAGRPLRATAEDGTPGHPVIFPRRLLARVASITGDRGARDVLLGEDVGLCPLPGRAAVTDLDTPADWAAWRQEARRPPG